MQVVKSEHETGHVVDQISDGWTVVSGEPTMTTWFEYQSDDKSIVNGTWRATPGVFHARSKYHEFVCMIDGEIVITAEGEESVTVRAGDTFNIPAGFAGTWDIREPVLKRFLLCLSGLV